jgi:hypothetical protein
LEQICKGSLASYNAAIFEHMNESWLRAVETITSSQGTNVIAGQLGSPPRRL